MKNLHFKKGKLSVWGIIVMSGFTLLALLTLLAGSIIGLFLLLPAIIILGIKEGVYIDVENRKYKSYLSVFGVSSAQWKPIPEGTVVGIKLLKLTARRSVGPHGLPLNDSTSSTTTFELYFYTPRPERVVLGISDNVEKLYFEAQNLASLLESEVFVDQRIPEEMYNRSN